jgi:hypothetical protein
MVGRDSPALQRYILADDGVDLVADRKDADVVIMVDVIPGPFEAGIMISPPVSGAGELTDVMLGEAALLSDSPVMAGVDLTGVGVRVVDVPVPADGSVALATIESQPILLAYQNAATPSRPSRNGVIIPFDIRPENTNWTLTPSFAIFMANAVRWAADQPEAGGGFETYTPIQLRGEQQPVFEWVEGSGVTVMWTFRSVSPGLYRHRDSGEMVAVSLIGLHGGQPTRSVAEQINAIELCEPSYRDAGRELWPAAAVAGLVFLLTGWLVAAKKD